MKPNLENAAEMAIETIINYNLDPKHADPAIVLDQLKNVVLISYGTAVFEEQFVDTNQDAVTLVNKVDGKLQYIVIYNHGLDRQSVRFALARELAHVILGHDGNAPEQVWSAEANCFAYHFMCPLLLTAGKQRAVNYRPIRFCLSWEMKDMLVFDSVDDMKSYIADEQNRFNKFIGKPASYEPKDVELAKTLKYDKRVGWKNCYDVTLDGKTIGHCGE